MANGSMSKSMVEPSGQQDALLGQVDRQLGVRVVRDAGRDSRACVAGSTTIGSRPFLRLLLAEDVGEATSR